MNNNNNNNNYIYIMNVGDLTNNVNPNKILKKIYVDKNKDEKNIRRAERNFFTNIRILLNMIIKVLFALTILYFLFNLMRGENGAGSRPRFKRRYR
tara:strand:+ start:318 stop:605 length:288 start_codon:yes stop_codon:yes gene_type:complete